MSEAIDDQAIEASKDAQFYRSLLVKYVQHVRCCKGYDYVEYLRFNREIKFCDCEREELEAIAKSVRFLNY